MGIVVIRVSQKQQLMNILAAVCVNDNSCPLSDMKRALCRIGLTNEWMGILVALDVFDNICTYYECDGENCGRTKRNVVGKQSDGRYGKRILKQQKKTHLVQEEFVFIFIFNVDFDFLARNYVR